MFDTIFLSFFGILEVVSELLMCFFSPFFGVVCVVGS